MNNDIKIAAIILMIIYMTLLMVFKEKIPDDQKIWDKSCVSGDICSNNDSLDSYNNACIFETHVFVDACDLFIMRIIHLFSASVFKVFLEGS